MKKTCHFWKIELPKFEELRGVFLFKHGRVTIMDFGEGNSLIFLFLLTHFMPLSLSIPPENIRQPLVL